MQRRSATAAANQALQRPTCHAAAQRNSTTHACTRANPGVWLPEDGMNAAPAPAAAAPATAAMAFSTSTAAVHVAGEPRPVVPPVTAPGNAVAAAARPPAPAGRSAEDCSTDEAYDCVICWDNPQTITLAPCGHLCLRRPCVDALTADGSPACPTCRCAGHLLR